MSELDRPVVVEFPLEGEWTVERSPADRVPSHGTDLLGQRYAFDFIRTDERAGMHVHGASTLRWVVIGGRTHECYGWGQPVLAAAGGEVIRSVEGVAEHEWIHGVREAWVALRNAAAFRRYGSDIDPARVAGNHVIVRTGPVYALYAHLAPASVAVVAGQDVAAGEVVGRVGHTGNSTAPHLHFQLMDSAEVRSMRGIACAFRQYLVRRPGGWVLVERAIPRRGERIRSPSSLVAGKDVGLGLMPDG